MNTNKFISTYTASLYRAIEKTGDKTAGHILISTTEKVAKQTTIRTSETGEVNQSEATVERIISLELEDTLNNKGIVLKFLEALPPGSLYALILEFELSDTEDFDWAVTSLLDGSDILIEVPEALDKAGKLKDTDDVLTCLAKLNKAIDELDAKDEAVNETATKESFYLVHKI